MDSPLQDIDHHSELSCSGLTGSSKITVREISQSGSQNEEKKSSTRSPEHFDDAVEIDSQPASPGVNSPSPNQTATESAAKAMARKALSDPLAAKGLSRQIVRLEPVPALLGIGQGDL